MKKLLLLSGCALWLFPFAGTAQDWMPRDTRTMTDPMVHDPVLAQEGNTYYLFSTGRNLTCMSSEDLKKWRFEPQVFTDAPRWAMDSVPGYEGHTWAPDILYYKGNYHLFYSCSTFGKNTSAIGHAFRSTLDPNDPEPWTDTGAVIVSRSTDDYNAIDPNVVVDENGVPWMTFGSFWGGIRMVQLTEDMASCAQPENVYTLCTRKYVPDDGVPQPDQNAVEAPFIFRHDGFYYLFVSYDFCCRGLRSNYRVVVGRSADVCGPYVDREGRSLMQGGGTPVVSSDNDFVAIGHSAAYRLGDKDYFLAHGYSRRQNGASKLFLKEMDWDEEGWPVLKPLE